MKTNRLRSLSSNCLAAAGVVLLFVAVVLMPLEEARAQSGYGCSQPPCGSSCQGTCSGKSAPCDGFECTDC